MITPYLVLILCHTHVNQVQHQYSTTTRGLCGVSGAWSTTCLVGGTSSAALISIAARGRDNPAADDLEVQARSCSVAWAGPGIEADVQRSMVINVGASLEEYLFVLITTVFICPQRQFRSESTLSCYHRVWLLLSSIYPSDLFYWFIILFL